MSMQTLIARHLSFRDSNIVSTFLLYTVFNILSLFSEGVCCLVKYYNKVLEKWVESPKKVLTKILENNRLASVIGDHVGGSQSRF